MSIISEKLDELIRLGLSDFMKAKGFKKTARSWHKKIGRDWFIVSIQSSSANLGSEGAFTINLGVYSAEVSLLAGQVPVTGKPKAYEATVRERVGSLAYGSDYWWKMDSRSGLGCLAQDVVSKMQRYGIPWLESHRSISVIAGSLEKQPSLESFAAALLAGGEAQAIARMKKAIASRPRAKAGYIAWADRVGLEHELF